MNMSGFGSAASRSNFNIRWYLLLSLALLSIILPVDPKRKTKSTGTKSKKAKYEEDSEISGSISSAETIEAPENYEELRDNFETVKRHLLLGPRGGRKPDPLPAPTSNKKLLAELKRDLADDLMTEMVISMSENSTDNLQFLIFNLNHTNEIHSERYKNVTDTFSKLCIQIEKNPYMNRFVDTFVNICDAEWLTLSKIESVFGKICEEINRFITDIV